MKADDLDSVTDPSKLSESDFAPGTKWTNAGWTRSNNANIAKRSEYTLGIDLNGSTISETGSAGFHYIGAKGSFTIDKNQVKKENTILLVSLQSANSWYGNDTNNNKQTITDFNDANFQGNANDVYFQGEKIGYVEYQRQDNAEIDLVLHITTNKNFATDPEFTLTQPHALIINCWTDKAFFHDLRQKKKIELYQITPTQVQKTTFKYGEPGVSYSKMDFSYPYNDTNGVFVGYGDADNDRTVPKPYHKEFKINSNLNINQDFTPIDATLDTPQRFVRDANNQVIWGEAENHIIGNCQIKYLENNLNLSDVRKQALNNGVTISKQDDGSVIVVENLDYNAWKDTFKDDWENMQRILKAHSYFYNVVQNSSDQQEAIIKNNNKFMEQRGYVPSERMMWLHFASKDRTKPFSMNITNLQDGSSYSQSFTPNGSTFNAELYKTTLVHYLDSSNKDSQVSNDSIMGIQNQVSNYQLNIPKGYILDTKSGKNKDGTQYKWSADKESIAYTFNEDQKLNDANPINIYITHGTHNTNDNSGKSTRTIQYTGLPDNLKPKDNVQTVLFKRSGVTDDVTGETTYGDWQPQSGNGHYTAVTSPTFAGYKPDQAVVPDIAATAGKDKTVTVNYSRTDQNAKLTVHDDTANTDLNDYAENSTGLYQDQINFKTTPSAVEQELKDKGYTIVSDSFKGSPTYNADDSKNSFVIHVTHKIVPVTPDQPKKPTDVIPDTKQHYPTGVDTNDLNKDVQRSIFYKYEDNTQAEPTVVQKAHFDRTVKVDAVTQKIVDNGTWSTKDSYPEVATKSIDGYTPDKTKVDSATPSMTTNQDQTVVYHANDEDAAITYIDDTTGKVLKTDTQKAKYKQTIKFATDPNTQIQTYKDQGYVLVSSDWKDSSTYQTDPARNKFTVHLKHGTSTVTPDKPKKSTDIIPGTKQHYPTGVDTNDLNQPQQRQITYTYADSKKQASPTVTQKATFHRTATVDNVTGKTTYTDWTTSDQYPEVKSPAIEGYTPDKSNVPVTKPVLNTKQDVAVVYNPNPEQVDVIAQDNTGKQLSKSTLHGNYNTDYTATTPVIKGYHLIKMPANTHGTYKTHNDSIIYIYAPDSNSVPEQTDGTPKPDKSSYPDDLTPAKRSPKLPETGSTTLASELKSDFINLAHLF